MVRGDFYRTSNTIYRRENSNNIINNNINNDKKRRYIRVQWTKVPIVYHFYT